MGTESKSEKMEELGRRLVSFKESPLYEYRTSNKYLPVIGEGSLDASIMFVGEAPGKTEALTGKPFCGAAGKFLSVLLESIGMSREKVYITNIVKDRPPENRDPTPEEIALYSPLLDKQVQIIKPKVIVTLGRHSMGYILPRYDLDNELAPISKLHGRTFETAYFDESASPQPVTILTLYHPAAALYNGGMRETLKKDFAVLKKYV